MWGFPKIRGTLLGVPIIRTIVFWGLHWGPHILGNYHLLDLGFQGFEGLGLSILRDLGCRVRDFKLFRA